MKEGIQVYEQLGLRDYTQNQIGLNEKPSYILPTEWGCIGGDIMNQRDLISLIDAGAHSEDKEVIGVLTYADTAPEDADEGDMYINSDENILYGLHSGQWAEADASTDVLYITADTSHIYIYNGTAFSDATGGVVDNTIYVSNITTGLESFTDPGLYTVCVARVGLSTQWYTMAVLLSKKMQRLPRSVITYYTQLLKNEAGYLRRTKTNNNEWGEWSEFIYASEKYVQETIAEEVTYAQLVDLRDAGDLIPYKKYRITDFVTTVANMEEARSAGHPFDLIVTAIDEHTLHENAIAALHSGDTYFSSSNLQAWEIKYCIDNDITRFYWADEENGKGVIFYMKDEFSNCAEFDFKNFQFKRYRSTIKEDYEDLLSESKIMLLQENGEGWYDINDSVLDLDSEDFIWCYSLHDWVHQHSDASLGYVEGEVYSPRGVYRNEILCNRICVSYDDAELHTVLCPSNIVLYTTLPTGDDQDFEGIKTYGNVFGVDCCNLTISKKCHNSRFIGTIMNSTFAGEVRNTTFSGYINSTTFSGGIGNTTFSGYIGNTTFSGYVRYATFSGDIYGTTFSGYIYYTTFSGDIWYSNFSGYIWNGNFSGYIDSTTFSGYIESTTFSGYIERTTFSGYIGNTTFSGYIERTTFSGNLYNGSIHGRLYDVSIGSAGETWTNLVIDPGVEYVAITCAESGDDEIKNVHIFSGVCGTSSTTATVSIPTRNNTLLEIKPTAKTEILV
ncbi:MAG: hypothetical protein IJP45_02515 [Paludibacteraceae bacterium]|nr:hypothetical protein [Paludibacteraceae bacterium]